MDLIIDKKRSTANIKKIECNIKIDKRELEYNHHTFAVDNFTLNSEYQDMVDKFETEQLDKKRTSEKEIIDSIDDISYKFSALEDLRFKRLKSDDETKSEQEARLEELRKKQLKEDGSEPELNAMEIRAFENKEGLHGFNIENFNRKVYRRIYKEKYSIKKEKDHGFLQKLKHVEDFAGSMVNAPQTELFIVENSTLRGKFMISQPLYNEITPIIDFGDEVLHINRGMKIHNPEKYDFFGDYDVKRMKKGKGPMDPLEYSLQLSGLIYEKQELFEKVENLDDKISDQLLSYLGVPLTESSKAKSKRKARTELQNQINSTFGTTDQSEADIFDSSLRRMKASTSDPHDTTSSLINLPMRPSIVKVRYFEAPDKHQIKRNFQVQVDVKEKHERTLTLNDFQNKMNNLVLMKQKVRKDTGSENFDYKEQEHYLGEIEETLDIILNLKPEIVKGKMLQTLNQKVKTLIQNIDAFKDVYLGKLYCPEIIIFILKEYLEQKHGVEKRKKIFDRYKKLHIQQGGKKKTMSREQL